MDAVTGITDSDRAVFGADTRAQFAVAYPETPVKLHHNLEHHPLLTLEALAGLAGKLPNDQIEYNRGDLPIGLDGKPTPTGLSIEETILHVATSNSWAVLKNIQQVPEYETLLLSLLGELKPVIEEKTGAMLRPQGFIFISSPNAVTPYHFDPEHNILLQLTGSKTMVQFPAGDNRFAPDTTHETYHSGGPRELTWADELAAGATEFPLAPGEAVMVPVMAPHYVKVGPDSSISLSITWRSDWSFAEADARCWNGVLRKAGLNPRAPGRWPHSNKAKATAFRIWRRLGLGS
ncbi:transcriptional regulator [Altererythrobacter sp. FM1]|uniref:transcriptional regulator n=1 Tax=Tsuneonella flava TaxID=2055955 RepID=UPI000C8006D1|nr:transcriptional regulator [Tsuneonella flava]ROT93343.1 transcriptional regulator [Altererythrobacter sp. FM1]